jgi:hypothetical protein
MLRLRAMKKRGFVTGFWHIDCACLQGGNVNADFDHPPPYSVRYVYTLVKHLHLIMRSAIHHLHRYAFTLMMVLRVVNVLFLFLLYYFRFFFISHISLPIRRCRC